MARSITVEESVFNEFVGKEVKAPFLDGNKLKVAKGKLVSASNGFVKIQGKLGTVVINEKNVERMAVINNTN